MFTRNYTIVDVETTGGNPATGRIIEIGLLRIEKGRVAAKYRTFVNPGLPIPEFITEFTGIAERHVRSAPGFTELAEGVLNYFEDAVLVAHNSSFDYGFLKAEFRRAGLAFSCETLCTVRLSRVLYPEHKRHNLSAIIDRFDFRCKRRHRALDDAVVVWDFLKMAARQFPADQLGQTVRQTIKKIAPKQQLREIKQPAGLEYIADEQ